MNEPLDLEVIKARSTTWLECRITDIPSLIDEVERLQARVAEREEVLLHSLLTLIEARDEHHLTNNVQREILESIEHIRAALKDPRP